MTEPRQLSLHQRRRLGWREWLLAGCVLLASDALAAQLMLWAMSALDVTRRAERLERRYRVPSEVYHHDLTKRFDGIGAWGPLRYRVRTNSLGFRDASRRIVPLRSEQARVLLIGDSFTEGVGLEYERTYAGIIARRLAKEGVEVLNASAASYSPAIYYSKVRYLLESIGLQFAEVVVFIDVSDIEDEAKTYVLHPDGRVTMKTQQPRDSLQVPGASASSLGKLKKFLKRHSILVRSVDLMKDWLQGENQLQDEDRLLIDNPRSLWTVRGSLFEAYGRTGLEYAGRHMNLLATLLHQYDIPLTVAVYPWPDQVMYDSAGSIQMAYWREWAAHAGAQFIDLFRPFFRSSDREATIRAYYLRGDLHFNARGSMVMASTFLGTYRRRTEGGPR